MIAQTNYLCNVPVHEPLKKRTYMRMKKAQPYKNSFLLRIRPE